jgi:hypothetical protein
MRRRSWRMISVWWSRPAFASSMCLSSSIMRPAVACMPT